MTGFLTASSDAKRVFAVIAVVGFAITSMLCGAAQSLGQIVVFRLLQGCLAPVWYRTVAGSAAEYLPKEQHGKAMAMWGVRRDGGTDPGAVAGRLADRILQLALGVSTLTCPSGCWPGWVGDLRQGNADRPLTRL